MSNTTTNNIEYREALSKALRKINKALDAVTVAASMAEPGSNDELRLRAAMHFLDLTLDQVEANVAGATSRICGERSEEGWSESEFRQGFDAALDVMFEYFGVLKRTTSEDRLERARALNRVFDRREQGLTPAGAVLYNGGD